MSPMMAPSELVSLLLHAIGTLICLGLAIVFHIAAINRLAVLKQPGNSPDSGKRKRESDASRTANLPQETSPLLNGNTRCPNKIAAGGDLPALPSIAVIMPVKGIREHSVSNWRSQLDSDYSGRLHFFFVTGSEDDLAFAATRQLSNAMQLDGDGYSPGSDFRGNDEPGENSCHHCTEARVVSDPQQGSQHATSDPIPSFPGERHVTVLSAGRAVSCSQKIHNLLAGVEASRHPSSGVAQNTTHRPEQGSPFDLLLFLDDDVELHPHSIASLSSELVSQLDVFAVTGYPFDIPSPSSLFSYFAGGFHWSIIAWLSVAPATDFLWGGCLMVRARDIHGNALNVLTEWRDGGYSDDMILSALAVQHRCRLLCPRYAVFPQRLPSRMTAWQWWNYQRRQLFVLSTHVSPGHLATNLQLLVVGSLLGIFLSASLLATGRALIGQAVAVSLSLGLGTAGLAGINPNPPLPAGLTSSPTVALWLAVAPHCHLFAFLLASSRLHRMLFALCSVCHALNPRAVPPPGTQMRLFPLLLVWLAIAVTWLSFAVLAVVNVFVPEVLWSGIRYRRRKGRCQPVWDEGDVKG